MSAKKKTTTMSTIHHCHFVRATFKFKEMTTTTNYARGRCRLKKKKMNTEKEEQ
jgi:hypothetical protein